MPEDDNWKKYKSVGPDPDMSVAARLTVRPFELEVKIAKKKRLYAPNGGLPDREGIKKAWGLTPNGVIDDTPDINVHTPGCRRLSRHTNDFDEHDDNLALHSDV